MTLFVTLTLIVMIVFIVLFAIYYDKFRESEADGVGRNNSTQPDVRYGNGTSVDDSDDEIVLFELDA